LSNTSDKARKGAGVSRWVNEGINFIRKGNLVEAERALRIAVKENSHDIEAWLWLSQAVESDAEKMTCLLKVLEMDPRNLVARQKLASLQQRSRVDGGAHVDPFELDEPAPVEAQNPVVSSDSPFLAASGVEEEGRSEPAKERADYAKYIVIGLLLLMVTVMIFLLATLFR